MINYYKQYIIYRMKDINIQKMRTEDIKQVVDIWYEVSLKAHKFISEEYWKTNKELMRTQYLPMSETYTATINNKMIGFISLVNNYLAAIFIKHETQGKGIGTALINHAKDIRETLQLKVFVKNKLSVEFYKKNGFKIKSETNDSATGEKEFTMEWHIE